MYYSESDGTGAVVLKIVGLIILVIIISSFSRSCSRSDNNMIYIEDGYCYDEDTKIIYKESIVGRYDTDTTYTVYYDENGYVCKYDSTTMEWIAVTN